VKEIKKIKQELKLEVERIFCDTTGMSLTEDKILTMLLAYTNCEEPPAELAKRLIQRFGMYKYVFRAPQEELLTVPGVTTNVAALIVTIGGIYRHTCMEYQKKIGTRVADTRDLFRNAIDGSRYEELWIAGFDKREYLRSFDRLVCGNSQAIVTSTSSIIQYVFQHNLDYVIIAHNHPFSGEQFESEADRHTHYILKSMLESVSIELRKFFVLNRYGDIIEVTDTQETP